MYEMYKLLRPFWIEMEPHKSTTPWKAIFYYFEFLEWNQTKRRKFLFHCYVCEYVYSVRGIKIFTLASIFIWHFCSVNPRLCENEPHSLWDDDEDDELTN